MSKVSEHQQVHNVGNGKKPPAQVLLPPARFPDLPPQPRASKQACSRSVHTAAAVPNPFPFPVESNQSHTSVLVLGDDY